MNLVCENSEAANGAIVTSSVTLHIEEIGIDTRPFCVVVRVNGVPLFHAWTTTAADAKTARERMHGAYTEVHSTPA